MKNTILILCAFLLLPGTISTLQAQSKKKLRAQIERLNDENSRLIEDKNRLEQKNTRLQQMYSSVNNQNLMLENQISTLELELSNLTEKYESLFAQQGGTGNSIDNGDNFNESPPITNGENFNEGPAKGLDCEAAQGALNVNNTYRTDFSQMRSNGYGIQVASYSKVCQAVSAAEDFKMSHAQFDTYIRVKYVNGRTLYSVVYGVIPSKQEARTYARNLQRSGIEGQGLGAFVVKH